MKSVNVGVLRIMLEWLGGETRTVQMFGNEADEIKVGWE